MVERADIIQSYLTNPHYDLFQTGRRAGRALFAAVLGGARPVSAWRSIPMVLGGGSTVNLLAPMRQVFKRIKTMLATPGVLGVSLNMCHMWNDSPDLGWSVYAVTDGDEALANALVEELADLAWAVRDAPVPDFLNPTQAIEAVRSGKVARMTGAFYFVDASDVVGSGATGENTHLLRALLEQGQGLRSLVPILDARAVSILWDGPLGVDVSMDVGGRLDPQMYPPTKVTGRVVTKRETDDFGRAVVLDLGDVQLVVTEKPPYNLRPKFFTDVGLSPLRADIVVVKSFFHFRIFSLPLMRGSFMVRTKGLTDLDLMKKIALNRPVYPFQEVEDWRDGAG
jgi:microcystin degradation protein MlrC